MYIQFAELLLWSNKFCETLQACVYVCGAINQSQLTRQPGQQQHERWRKCFISKKRKRNSIELTCYLVFVYHQQICSASHKEDIRHQFMIIILFFFCHQTPVPMPHTDTHTGYHKNYIRVTYFMKRTELRFDYTAIARNLKLVSHALNCCHQTNQPFSHASQPASLCI